MKFIDSPIARPRFSPVFQPGTIGTVDTHHQLVDVFIVLVLGFIFIQLELAGNETLGRKLTDRGRIAVVAGKKCKALDVFELSDTWPRLAEATATSAGL